MKIQAKLVSSLLLGLSVWCQIVADTRQAVPPAASEFDQFAHFIAGRPAGRPPWAALEQTPTWEEHARQCNRAWLRLVEPAGSLPDWQSFSEENWSEYVTGLLTSLEEILDFTFFRTGDIKQHLEEKEGSGILPMLLFFLARTGHEVIGIDRVPRT